MWRYNWEQCSCWFLGMHGHTSYNAIGFRAICSMAPTDRKVLGSAVSCSHSQLCILWDTLVLQLWLALDSSTHPATEEGSGTGEGEAGLVLGCTGSPTAPQGCVSRCSSVSPRCKTLTPTLIQGSINGEFICESSPGSTSSNNSNHVSARS